MPLYEYECKVCGSRFEKLVFDRNAKVSCEACGDKKIARVLSTFSIASSTAGSTTAMNPGPCGACGAPQRGMCETMN